MYELMIAWPEGSQNCDGTDVEPFAMDIALL